MAATFTLSGNIANAPGVLFASRQISLYVLPSQNVTDATTGTAYFGPIKVSVDDNGLWSVELLATNATDITPPPVVGETFKYRVLIRYVDVRTTTVKDALTGYFDLTSDLNFEDIDVRVLEQVTAEFAVNLLTQAGVARDQALSAQTLAQQAAADAVDISNISTSDDAVEALVKGTAGAGPKTRSALLASIAAATARPAVDGQHQRVILFGTSQEIANQGGAEVVVSASNPASPVPGRGWANRAHEFLDHQTYTRANAGVSGNRYDQMRARLGTDVLAVDGDWVWMGGFINDVIQDRTFDQIKADLDPMIAAIVSAGYKVALLNTPAATQVNTSGRRTALAAGNAYVASLPAVYPGRVVVADVFTAISDPATVQPLANMTIDGTHYSDTAAVLIGRVVAEAVRSVTPPPVAGSRSEVGRPSTVQLLANPFLTSAGWATSNPSPGTVAASWAVPGTVGLTYAGVTTADIDQGVSLGSPLTVGITNKKVRLRARAKWTAVDPLTIASGVGPVARMFGRKADDSFELFVSSSLNASSENRIPDLFPRSGECTVQTPWYQTGPTVDRLYLGGYMPGISAGTVWFSDIEVLVKP